MSDRHPDPPFDADRPRWSVADDYLADPAVAPLRALLGALARRLGARRSGRGRASRARRGRRPRRASGPPPPGTSALRPPGWMWGRIRS